MELDFSQEQRLLADTVARLCEDYHGSAALRSLEADDNGYFSNYWQALSQAGLAGLNIAEQYGGTGLGSLEVAVVHEQMGRSLAPSPHLQSCVIAASLLQDAGNDAQKSNYLPRIASGELIVIPAWQEAGASADVNAVSARLSGKPGKRILSGEKVLVPFASKANSFLIAVKDEKAELQFLLVPAERASFIAQANHADQSLFAVSFDKIDIEETELLSTTLARDAWDDAMLKGLIAIAAQAVGGASHLLEMTIDYAKQREQFGQAIGGFQAIAHYLADRATEIEGARYLMYQAAWACDNGEDWTRLALLAKQQATAVFRRTAVTAVQVHGGMGFSSEADPQLYYRRAKHLQLMYWDPRYLEARIANEVFG